MKTIHRACLAGDNKTVIQCLAQDKAAVNAVSDVAYEDYMEITPAHCACMSGSVECLATLLNAGANIKAKAKGFPGSGNRSLDLFELCVQWGSLDCARLLLERGWKASRRVYTQLLPFELDRVETLIFLAKCGVPLDGKDSGLLLSNMASCGNAYGVELMLKAGVDPNLNGPLGHICIFPAILDDHANVVSVFVGYGVRLDAVNMSGFTPATHAVSRNSLNSLSVIVKSKLKYDYPDKVGRTPKGLAREMGNDKALVILGES